MNNKSAVGSHRPCASGRQRFAAFSACLLLLVAGACDRRGDTTSANAPKGGNSRERADSRPAAFQLSQSQLEHMRIVPVERATWSLTVSATGTVDWDNDHTTQAISQVGGPIGRIAADTGTYVEAGDPLLFVSSPDFTGAIAAYRKAKNRLNFQLQQLNRSRDLFEHQAIAQKDLESAEADYNDAATEVQNDLQGLKIYGITEREIEQAERQGVPISPELAVRSPISGTVVQKLISPGQVIQAGTTTCFLISNFGTVWVQGHLYERDLTSVRVGDEVEMTNSALPGAFHGKVSYIGAMIDPATRTTPLRIVTRNPDGLLKKDLFLDLAIHTRTKRGILVVPESAILYDSDNQPFVYVESGGEGRFAQRLIAPGQSQNKQVEIMRGLNKGEKVVADGSIFLQLAATQR
jgi:membrane fusion protein, heavy metal efflux system